MTAYATRAQLYAMGLPSAALTGVALGDQDTVLDACSRVVDSYLVGRYEVPITVAVPSEIVRVVCVLAAYDLMVTRGFNPDGPDSNLKERADMAITWLRDCAKGLVSLDLDDVTAANEANDPGPYVSSDTARGW